MKFSQHNSLNKPQQNKNKTISFEYWGIFLVAFFIRMSNASREKFCLKWNDFESNISSSFKDIKDEKDFMDVTLACE